MRHADSLVPGGCYGNVQAFSVPWEWFHPTFCSQSQLNCQGFLGVLSYDGSHFRCSCPLQCPRVSSIMHSLRFTALNTNQTDLICD